MVEPPKRFAAVALELPSVENDAAAVAADGLSVCKPLLIGTTAAAGSGARDPIEMTAGVTLGSNSCMGKEAG